jgi:hypothetical protein
MKQKNIKTHRILAIVLLLGLGLIGSSSVASNVKAQSTSGDYTVLAPLPCIEGGGITCTTGGNGAVQPTVNFKTYVQYTINLLIGLSAVVAVVMIVWGGVEYMYTASFSGKKMGLEKVTHAIYGLVLVLTSYIILRTIDPRLVEIPNTIVPTIEIQSSLTRDTSGILMQQVENEINEYKIKSAEIGKEMQNFVNDKNKKRAELAEIDNELKTISLTDPKFKELILNKTKKEDEIRQIDIKYQVQKTKSELNGIMISSSDLAANLDTSFNWASNSVVDQVASMRVDKAAVVTTQQRSLTVLKNLGSVDNSEIISSANYTNAVIDLNIINVISVTATNKYTNAGMGIGGANTSNKIIVVSTEAKEREFSSKSEAKKYLQEEINKITAIKSSITDQTLKNNLQTKIDEAQKRLNSSKVFN